ncbi:DUF4180 domain-containing protein [Streptomyces sp. JJ66]|uniref:DUF4180 domain-containing protein n=1 Tax=Streptomyces sp. JJ66 TaxID=2803843 RepID=UPI001C58C469|nr:DUF4180 domain-containing protein [Streptomyces sp. JJ66]MBW1603946.1 DUF4180 domain-containing protein [Streptomyces sp. JJ66]
MTTVDEIDGVPVLRCPEEGEPIRGGADVLDLIGNAGYHGAEWVVVPAGRLDASFFQLRTRVAGDIVQKFAQYRVGLVVVGDISRHTEASGALRDFVRECDRAGQTWFVPDAEALRERLAARRRR